MDRTIGIGDLQNLEKFLNGEPFTETPGGPIYYVEEIKTFIVDQSKIYPYKKSHPYIFLFTDSFAYSASGLFRRLPISLKYHLLPHISV